MSHVVRMNGIKVLRPDLLKQVALLHGWPVQENVDLGRYATAESKTGMTVQLPGWQYPVYIAQDGTISYDNWGGRWGRQEHLQKMVQDYVVAQVQDQATAAGQWVEKEVRQDGTVVLRVGEGLGGGW